MQGFFKSFPMKWAPNGVRPKKTQTHRQYVGSNARLRLVRHVGGKLSAAHRDHCDPGATSHPPGPWTTPDAWHRWNVETDPQGSPHRNAWRGKAPTSPTFTGAVHRGLCQNSTWIRLPDALHETWKGHPKKNHPQKATMKLHHRILSEIYAKLIAVLLQNAVMLAAGYRPIYHNFMKTAKYIAGYARATASSFHHSKTQLRNTLRTIKSAFENGGSFQRSTGKNTTLRKLQNATPCANCFSRAQIRQKQLAQGIYLRVFHKQ